MDDALTCGEISAPDGMEVELSNDKRAWTVYRACHGTAEFAGTRNYVVFLPYSICDL